MKTVNLMPWCNLFSAASKYSICVGKSHYRVLLYTGTTVIFSLLLLIFFTYHYHIALAIAALVMMLIGGLLVKKSNHLQIISTFELGYQGRCTFHNEGDYQLQENSRFSFLGCWLILQPVPTISTVFNAKNNNSTTLFFIFRDSLSKQDFSRLSQVITQLNCQH